MTTNKQGNILLIVISAVALIAVALAGYFYLQIPKGQSVNVGNYTKIIPDSKPTDVMADWKTFTSDSLNISFKYPNDWFASESGSSQFPELRIQNYTWTGPGRGYSPEADKGKYLLTVNRYPVGSGVYSLEALIKSLPKEGDEARVAGDLAGTVRIVDQKTGDINGFPALWRASIATMYPKIVTSSVYILDKKGNAIVTYDGLDTEGGKEIRSQIVSTFKFIDTKNAWKTYTNSSQKFQIDYPSDWTLFVDSLYPEQGNVSLSSPEAKTGVIKIYWGGGFGGGPCPSEHKQVQTKAGIIDMCRQVFDDGSISMSRANDAVGETIVDKTSSALMFSVAIKDPTSEQAVLDVFKTFRWL